MLGGKWHRSGGSDDASCVCRITRRDYDCAGRRGVDPQVFALIIERAVVEVRELPEYLDAQTGQFRHGGQNGIWLGQALDREARLLSGARAL